MKLERLCSMPFILWWVLVSTATTFAGNLVLIAAVGFPPIFSAYPAFVIASIGQAILLRRHMARCWLFPIFSALGAYVTFLVNWYFPIMLGLIAGCLQWLLMIRAFRWRSLAWPVCSGIAWAAGLIVAWIPLSARLQSADAGAQSVLLYSTLLSLPGLVCSAGTGVALATMDAQRRARHTDTP